MQNVDLQLVARDAVTVQASFSMADGYYLYRSRFGFDSGTPNVTLGAAVFPRGATNGDPVMAGWFTLNGNGEMTGTPRQCATCAAIRPPVGDSGESRPAAVVSDRAVSGAQ